MKGNGEQLGGNTSASLISPCLPPPPIPAQVLFARFHSFHSSYHIKVGLSSEERRTFQQCIWPCYGSWLHKVSLLPKVWRQQGYGGKDENHSNAGLLFSEVFLGAALTPPEPPCALWRSLDPLVLPTTPGMSSWPGSLLVNFLSTNHNEYSLVSKYPKGKCLWFDDWWTWRPWGNHRQ